MINSVWNVCLVTSQQQLLVICYCSCCNLLFNGQGTDSFQTRYTHIFSILRAICAFNWSCTNRELAWPIIRISAFRRNCAPAFWRVCIPPFRGICTTVFRRVFVHLFFVEFVSQPFGEVVHHAFGEALPRSGVVMSYLYTLLFPLWSWQKNSL